MALASAAGIFTLPAPWCRGPWLKQLLGLLPRRDCQGPGPRRPGLDVSPLQERRQTSIGSYARIFEMREQSQPQTSRAQTSRETHYSDAPQLEAADLKLLRGPSMSPRDHFFNCFRAGILLEVL